MNRYEIITNSYDDDYYLGAPASGYRGQLLPSREPRVVEATRYAMINESGYFMINFYGEDEEVILTMFSMPREIRKLNDTPEIQE